MPGVPGRHGETRRRERLIAAMGQRCAAIGYPRVTVASVSAHAGVSTATFYECFEHKEACLAAACRDAAQRIFGDAHPTVPDGPPDALRLTLERVLSGCERDPNARSVLFEASLAAGPRVRRERDHALLALECKLEAALEGSPGERPGLDLPAAAVTGALTALLARSQQSSGELRAQALLDELHAWAGTFEIPAGHPRRSVTDAMLLAGAPARWDAHVPDACARGPARLPRGRHRLPVTLVGRLQRQRLLHGLAQATLESGFADVTVKDIVAAAAVARGVFYEHFTSKHDAFLAAQDLASAELLREVAHAYFQPASWPERVWSAVAALSAQLAANPALAHLCLIECYAAGPRATRRTEQLRGLAAILMFEGLSSARCDAALPEHSADMSAGAVLELLRRDLAVADTELLCRRLPQLVYLTIAPLEGAAHAARLVRELAAERDPLD